MWRDNHYVATMSGNPKNRFTPCIPTRGTGSVQPQVFHEVKQDGFRLIGAGWLPATPIMGWRAGRLMESTRNGFEPTLLDMQAVPCAFAL
jgi:hypothetical protein